MSKKKNVITLSARPNDLFLMCEGGDDYVGIPCLKFTVKYPAVVFTPTSSTDDTGSTDHRVKPVKIGATEKKYFLMVQRGKIVVAESYNNVTSFASTHPIPMEGLMTSMSFSRESKVEIIKGLISLAINNFCLTLNKNQYADCGFDFDFKGGFTPTNRGDMIDQFVDSIMIYFDIMLYNGDNYTVSDLQWYYARRGTNVNTGEFSNVYILPAIASRIEMSLAINNYRKN